jgi:hypothetical protein
MELKHVVVDGSNIATEGRSLPSLKQLDEAVRSFLAENPTEHVTVIVDATFGHRIDASERAEYEEAILAGELITPPAGAIGRGDKFVLQIANRADAAILSNDSFQEFHGDYPWLFDEGRLIGGKPVPGVGWVFLLRTPVRGPASRRSVRDARLSGSAAAVGDGNRPRRGGRRRKASVTADAEVEVEAAVKAVADAPRSSLAPINDPLPFIEFVANHPVGSHVDGEVERFASHGAYVRAGGARCYLGLKFMGDPAPRSAKDVLRIGETRTFAVHGFDTPRRGIDLALVITPEAPADPADKKKGAPASAEVAGETKADGARPRRPRRKVAAGSATTQDRSDEPAADAAGARLPASETDISTPRDSPVNEQGKDVDSASNAATARVAVTKAPTMTSSTATKSAVDNAQEAPVTPAKKAVAKKATAKKRAVAKRAPAKKKAVAKKATTVRKTAARKATAKRAPAKKATAKKAVAKRTPAKKTAAKKATARKATAKRAPAKRATAKKATAKRAPAKRATAKKATAKRTTVRKAAVRKTAAKKVGVKRAAVKRAPARKAVTRTTAVRRTAAAKAPTSRTVAKRAPAR